MELTIIILGNIAIWAAGWLLIYMYIKTSAFLGKFVSKIPSINLKNFIYISFGIFTWLLISSLYWGYPMGIIINLIILFIILWGWIFIFLFEIISKLSEASKPFRNFIGTIFLILSKIPIIGNSFVILIILMLLFMFSGVEVMVYLIKYLKVILI
tara:strand:- start:56 stop:520 length:465 start_codon:yes stop_codon:yes gene_type:complete